MSDYQFANAYADHLFKNDEAEVHLTATVFSVVFYRLVQSVTPYLAGMVNTSINDLLTERKIVGRPDDPEVCSMPCVLLDEYPWPERTSIHVINAAGRISRIYASDKERDNERPGVLYYRFIERVDPIEQADPESLDDVWRKVCVRWINSFAIMLEEYAKRADDSVEEILQKCNELYRAKQIAENTTVTINRAPVLIAIE